MGLNSKVSVIGLGVGYALACCLAEAGYRTVGVDIDPRSVAHPRKDASVERLLKRRRVRAQVAKNLSLTTRYDAIKTSRFIIVCVSTGDEKKLVLGHVEDSVRQALRVLRSSPAGQAPVLMVYSTLPFGSSLRLRQVFNEEKVAIDRQVGYVHFPLMIAQGTTAEDFVNPPFVVFGAYDPNTAKRSMNFYRRFITRSCLLERMPPMFTGTPEEAELAKLTANAYLTTKIALSNEFGALCEQLNIDGQKIMEIVGSDWRIGRKFTRPGYAAGGACFPRDLKSLIETYRTSRVEPCILSAVDASNESRKTDPMDKIEGTEIAVLGTSYKSGVRDERGSPALDLIKRLRNDGFSVETFNPKSSNKVGLRAVVQNKDTVIVTIPEVAFRELGKNLGERVKVVLDYSNIVDGRLIPAGVRFWQAGRGWSILSTSQRRREQL